MLLSLEVKDAFEPAQPQFWTRQVREDAKRPTRCLLHVAQPLDGGGFAVEVPVRVIQAGDVHAGRQHSGERRRFVA